MSEEGTNQAEIELAKRANTWRAEVARTTVQKENTLKNKTEEMRGLMEELMGEIAYLYTSSNALPLNEERDFSGLYVNGEKWSLVVSEPRYHKLDSPNPDEHRSEVVATFNKENNEKDPVNVIITKETDGRLNVQMKEGAKPWVKVPGRAGENGSEDPKFKPEDLASNQEAFAALPYSLSELTAVINAAQARVDGFKDVHTVR